MIVMGVSGSGKSTVAEGIAKRTGWTFAEADEFHPKANIAKMEAGTPLTDEDRWPWLEALNEWMVERAADGESTVITCSALRRIYRDRLRQGLESLDFIHLHGPAEVIAERMKGRKGHFMPPALLQSQIDTLEALEPDESGVVLDLTHSPEQLVDEAVVWLEGADRGGAGEG
ncbi:gluconate kinase [Knoellia sinensis KCTC 19936]|uniref:Gluconokinase n=1 Tax=Knoellia sinensis KCTC 19936 TaxID=1385520 RepID=A0A0A0JEZ8_9MICO|nr:gluconate kinase [Knoellia sinensis KCTC 19936]